VYCLSIAKMGRLATSLAVGIHPQSNQVTRYHFDSELNRTGAVNVF
jgi:hypothetical protein